MEINKMSRCRSKIWRQFKSTWLTTLFSALLFSAVTYLLFWNERQAVVMSLVLREASEAVVSVDPFSPNLLTAFEGRLVHTIGPVKILEPLTEPDYNIQVLSVKLKKRVQMYQWIEESTDTGSETDSGSYTYYTDWRDYLVDSNSFYLSPGHHNPKDMPVSGQTFIAESVKIGYLTLGMDIKKKFSDYYDITSDERPDRHDIKLHSGAYYHGADPLVHEVGDLRIIFSYAGRNNDEYTTVGILIDGVVRPFVSGHSPEPLVMLRKGRHSSKDMLTQEFRDTERLTWRYRAVGWFQMFAAAMSLHPDWFELLLSCPWVSPRVREHGRVSANLVVTTCGTLFIISAARLMHSPLSSVVLLIVSIMPVLYFSTASQYAVVVQQRSDRSDDR